MPELSGGRGGPADQHGEPGSATRRPPASASSPTLTSPGSTGPSHTSESHTSPGATSPATATGPEPGPARWSPGGAASRLRQPVMFWLGVYGIGVVVLGALLGVLWAVSVPLSSYHINADGGATTTEQGLAGFVTGDVYFTLLGVLAGVAAGVLVWRWFGGLGWPSVLLAAIGATVMALTCWQVGWLLGPHEFGPRLAAAKPGDDLEIELTIRAYSSLLVWPFGAVLPMLLFSALSSDPEEYSGPSAAPERPGSPTSPARAADQNDGEAPGATGFWSHQAPNDHGQDHPGPHYAQGTQQSQGAQSSQGSGYGQGDQSSQAGPADPRPGYGESPSRHPNH